jgi:hypothetical protein
VGPTKARHGLPLVPFSALGCVAVLLPTAPALAWSAWYVNDDAAGPDTSTSWIDAFADLRGALSAAQEGDQVCVSAPSRGPDTRDESLPIKLSSSPGLCPRGEG